MQFRRLALRSIISLALGGAAGIELALAGGRIWALALQVVVQRVAEVGVAWASVPLRFQVGWSQPHSAEIRPIAITFSPPE
jgi:hypothetical protein